MMAMKGICFLLLCFSALSSAWFFGNDKNDDIDKDFTEWFTKKGGYLGGIELHQFENMGRGIKASQDLQADDVIISVPLKICMSRMTASKTSSRTINNMMKSLQNDEDVVALMLIRERALGGKSDWEPYIKTLPTSVPQGAYFSKEARDALHDPVLARNLKSRGEGIITRHSALATQLHVLNNYVKSTLSKKDKSGFNLEIQPFYDVTSLASYQWALSIVSSRALTFRGEKFLAPMCDMFNYSPHSAARSMDSGQFYLKHHKLDKEFEKTLTVTTDRSTQAGKQVFEDYGDNPSSLYLDHHGFVPFENPFDCVNLKLALTPSSTSTRSGVKQSLMERLGVSASPSACLHVSPGSGSGEVSDYGMSHEVWSWLMIHFNLQDNVLDKCLELLDRYAAGEDRNVLLAEVSEGACPLLASGTKPPPKVSTLKEVLLPVMIQRKEEMEDKESESKAMIDAEDVKLATTYRQKQLTLLEDMIQYTQNIIASHDLTEVRRVEVEIDPKTNNVISYTTQSSTVQSSNQKEVSKPNQHEDASPASDEEGLTKFVSNTWTDHVDCKDTDSNDSFTCAIAVFNAWVKSKHFPIQKIEAVQVPGMRIGTLATEPIQAEELYLAVPVNAVMDYSSALASGPLRDADLFNLVRKTGEMDFYVLLFHLLYEYKVLGTNSVWWPYLRLLPSLAEIKPPADYTEEELSLLAGSQVQKSIMVYKDDIKRRWELVRDKNGLGPAFSDLFPNLNEDEFRWGHYILDSRSIWWNNKRHLVPLLDLINCGGEALEGPTHRVHSTKLSKRGDTADTLSATEVAQGEQLFENYGQPNHIYLQYHGFVLDANSHDCVSVSIPIEAGDEGMEDVKNLRKRMKQYGFSSGVQSFCIANPVQLKRAVADAAKMKLTEVPLPALADHKMLAWLALKFGQSIGGDIRSPFKKMVKDLLARYPDSTSNSPPLLLEGQTEIMTADVAAGEGIGGGKGSNHPAAKLVKQEKEMLKALYDLL